MQAPLTSGYPGWSWQHWSKEKGKNGVCRKYPHFLRDSRQYIVILRGERIKMWLLDLRVTSAPGFAWHVCQCWDHWSGTCGMDAQRTLMHKGPCRTTTIHKASGAVSRATGELHDPEQVTLISIWQLLHLQRGIMIFAHFRAKSWVICWRAGLCEHHTFICSHHLLGAPWPHLMQVGSLIQ